MLLLWSCWVCALVACRNGEETGELSAAAGHLLHNDGRNFSKLDPTKQEPFHHRQQPLPDSTFNLRVQVNDMLSHQQLSHALVEVFVNYTKNSTALSREDGSALLHVPYHSGLPVTVVTNKAGYIPALLPCKTNKIPIFSSVTVSVLSLTQGNIWLFEDSVLITGKTAAASSQPIVRFPKSLLNLTDSSNITSVTAYVTIPELTSEQGGSLNALGIIISKSGEVWSVELDPVAAVSVQLFSGDMELNIRGPIQISLTVPDGHGLQTSDVPAWFFNRTVGGWMRKGLGKVTAANGKLMWTFTAPHLGYWIAAPLSPARGFFDLGVPVDFIFHHFFLLMVLFGGTLVTIICLLFGLLYYCRREPSESKATMIQPEVKKDQTTSTCDDDIFETSSRDVCGPQGGQNQAEKKDNQRNASLILKQNSNVMVNPGAVAIAVECNGQLNVDLSDVTFSHESSEQVRLPASLTDNFFFYNQPVAVLPAPAFFQLEEHLEQTQWSKSATLPRAGVSNGAGIEPKAAFPTHSQGVEAADQHEVVETSQDAGSTNASRSLPESVSVPGTLNKIRESRHSMKIPSSQPPRAWFVSLEGKPAAELRYTVSEQQRRRRPIESRETSLDSGVDMNELNQNASGRRIVTLERNATFVKSKHTPKQ